MRKILLFALLGLCQLTLAAENQLPAQDADTEAANAAPPSAESTQGNADSEELIAAEITETNEADDEEESSVRFIPTEQISQDLGVSFPVDI